MFPPGRSVGLSAPLMPRGMMPRFGGSAEGLNQEIEGLVLSAGSCESSGSAHDWVCIGTIFRAVVRM